MTIILAILHASCRNEKFDPSVLYLGTFIIDITIAEAFF